MPQVASIRRYPVKCMGGEGLEHALVDARGLAGDRWFAVVDADGRFAAAKSTRRFRRRDAILRYRAETERGSVQVTDGVRRWQVGERALDAELSEAAGERVSVMPEGEVAHHDAASVSLIGSATLDWFRDEWGVDADPRRLRANLVVTTEEPFVEEGWIGQEVHIGSSVLRAEAVAPRCRVVDLRQDGAVPSRPWLARLTTEREMRVALYLSVSTPGEIAVGDPVETSQPR